MNEKESLTIAIELEQLISETIILITKSIGDNPFEALNNCLKIVKQRNYHHFKSMATKIKTVGITLYGSQIINEDIIIKNLDEIYNIIREFK